MPEIPETQAERRKITGISGVAHSGLVVDADPRTRRWSVRLTALHATAAGGQIEGDLSVASASRGGFDLRSRWNTRRVEW